jgi:hypothetical protein
MLVPFIFILRKQDINSFKWIEHIRNKHKFNIAKNEKDESTKQIHNIQVNSIKRYTQAYK